MKRYKTFSVLVMGILVLSILVAGAGLAQGSRKARVIAHTEAEAKAALEKGCVLVRETKTLKAFVCPAEVALKLGLSEDVKVFAADSVANSQIKADLVQTSGNEGEGRKIAVLDTGYNYNHEELSSSYLSGKDFVNNDDDPFDDNGHGSHVAGIITADGIKARAKGVAPKAGVIAGKVLDAQGSGYFSDVVAAIYWVVDGPDGVYGTADDFKAEGISLSLGTQRPYVYKEFCDSVLPDLTTAIKYAVDKEVIVVTAAGNNGKAGISIPGCISYSTTVGAVDSKDKVAYFSGNGKALEITAPGVGIYSTFLGSSYVTSSGTSMATPMVSGVVALVKFAHPEYTVAQVQNALFRTVKDLGKAGWDSSYGWGRVDAYGAVS